MLRTTGPPLSGQPPQRSQMTIALTRSLSSFTAYGIEYRPPKCGSLVPLCAVEMSVFILKSLGYAPLTLPQSAG
jgi:hypothetical protein